MTIGISLKVNDGVVLATDSASTLTLQDGSGNTTHIVYNSANKVFNLRKGLPIGLMTWGLGSIGNSSVERLIKDFRARISDGEDGWFVDPQKEYEIKGIADRFKEFIYDHHYQSVYGDQEPKPDIGFMIAGYSSDADMAEEWRIQIAEGRCEGPTSVRPLDQCGMSWSGMPDAIQRLHFGVDPRIIGILAQAGMDQKEAERFYGQAREALKAHLVWDPMPIQDAIDLALFLIEVTIRYNQFLPGPDRVGGPIEVAAITKHERFKWVRRKHYYPSELNPKVDPHAQS